MKEPKAIQAMVLAAGRGERMRPLTDTTPKPLLRVQGKPLLQWHVNALARNGFDHILINTAWLGTRIPEYFGSKPLSDIGSPLSISYSNEGIDFGDALETAGGIVRALPLLDDVFWVLAGDVFAPDFVFSRAAFEKFASGPFFAHLWLVANPTHNLKGDFGLSAPLPDGSRLALNLPAQDPQARYTFSTIGLYRRELFQSYLSEVPMGNPLGLKIPLAPLLRRAMDNHLVSAEIYAGAWTDVGTPERLAELNTTPTDKTHQRHA